MSGITRLMATSPQSHGADYPDGLTPRQHREAAHPVELWTRRAVLAALAVILGLALWGVFGQTTGRAASGPLQVTTPDAVRGGLMYEMVIDIDPSARLRSPVLAISDPFWAALSVNSIVPDPDQSSYEGDAVRLSYDGPLEAGRNFRVRVYFQANPNTEGIRHGTVVLLDGATRVAAVERRLVIWP